MSNKLAITIRLEGDAREYYESYKDLLTKKIPSVSHTQVITSLIMELEEFKPLHKNSSKKSEVCA